MTVLIVSHLSRHARRHRPEDGILAGRILLLPTDTMIDAGIQVTLASPLGGQAPLDPKSERAGFSRPRRPRASATIRKPSTPLATTRKLSELDASDFDAVLYPGGHGPLWDLANDAASLAIIEQMVAAGKPVAAVCHDAGGAPASQSHPDGQSPRARKEGHRLQQQRRRSRATDRGGATARRGCTARTWR